MKDVEHGTLKTYIIGLTTCILLTLLSFSLVLLKLLSGTPLRIALVLSGLIQTWVQLVLFLHLGKESQSARDNLLVFLFMALILLTIVGGSLWILFSLDDRVMPHM